MNERFASEGLFHGSSASRSACVECFFLLRFYVVLNGLNRPTETSALSK